MDIECFTLVNGPIYSCHSTALSPACKYRTTIDWRSEFTITRCSKPFVHWFWLMNSWAWDISLNMHEILILNSDSKSHSFFMSDFFFYPTDALTCIPSIYAVDNKENSQKVEKPKDFFFLLKVYPCVAVVENVCWIRAYRVLGSLLTFCFPPLVQFHIDELCSNSNCMSSLNI